MIRVGKVLAHYEILEKIGAGGMGEVWKARDTTLNREVAIKVLPEIFSQDEDRRARFEREARLLAQLNHPGIAAVHGLHQDAGIYFLAMELVPGNDLYQRLQQGPLPVDEALKVGARVAEALEAAHEQGVIHRDLKPSNVVLMPGGAAKVLDFGLAKSVDPGSGDSDLSASPTMTSPGTMEGVILGTAAYMSPEQARGKAVDKRTDIWAFGCLLYECLTGITLFKGETVSDTIGAILHKEPEWDALPAATPPSIQLLIRRCLTRDAEHRLRDIGDARIEIGQAIQDPTGSYLGFAPTGEPAPAPTAKGRSRWLYGAVFGLLGLAVGALIAGSFRSSPEPSPLRKLDLGIAIEPPGDGDAPARISPDGTKVVFTHVDHLWVQLLDELEPRSLEDTKDARSPFWSPDGTQIGYFQGNRVWRIDAIGGRATLIAEIGALASGGYGGDWGADNRIIYSRGNTGIFSVSALGGEPKDLVPLEPGDGDFHEPSLLPDGGVVFVLHPEGEPPAVLAVVRDGERHEVFRSEDSDRVWRPVYSESGHILFGRSGGTSNGIWALPFDPATLSATGEAFLVVPHAASPSTSRDGTLAFVGGATYQSGNEQLLWVDHTGLVQGSEGGARNLGDYLSISPDGRYVAFGTREQESGNFDLFVRDLERATETRLTNNEDRFEVGYNWSPDGRELYFLEFVSGIKLGDAMTYRIPADGSGKPEPVVRGFPECLTPDGKTLMITHFVGPDSATLGPDTQTQIRLVPLDGSGETTPLLQSSDTTAAKAAISPDGRYVLYVSRASGHEEIFLTRFPEGTGRWQVSTSGGDNPQWDPRGDRVYFMEATKLMEVTVEPEGNAVRMGRPKHLFDIPSEDYRIHPDGQRFLIVGTPEKQDDELATRVGVKVVTNWIREFDQE